MLINRKSQKNGSYWYLEGFLGNDKKLLIPIKKDSFVVGRNQDSDLYLKSDDISRQHAIFRCSGSEIFVEDLQSTNGTFVNHKRIKRSTQVKAGDDVYFGDLKFKLFFKYEGDQETSENTLYLDRTKRTDDFCRHYDLTRREEEILYYMLKGESTRQIADVLFISIGTAKNHILKIYKKTEVHSKFELLTLYNKFTR